MARITTTYKANDLTEMASLLNAYLAPLIAGASVFIIGLDMVLNLQDRNLGTEYQATLTVETTAAPAVATPFEVVFLSEKNVTDLDAAYVTWYAANPTAFKTAARNISKITPSRLTQIDTWILTNATAGASANYTPL